ncbi:MAG: hypothetical protein ABIF08_00190 [Nanoarchaeota archaeon]
MIDWRILTASFAAIIVVSSMFMGGIGGDFFSNILDDVSNWLGSSPFSGFFITPVVKTHDIDLTIYPKQISLTPDSSVNFSSESSVIRNFKGTINLDFEEQTIVLEEADSSLRYESSIQNLEIEYIKLNTLSLDDLKLKIAPDITSENGSAELYNFQGKLTITSESLKFEGNVSKIVAKIGDSTWELK